jgi:hypothetical protein
MFENTSGVDYNNTFVRSGYIPWRFFYHGGTEQSVTIHGAYSKEDMENGKYDEIPFKCFVPNTSIENMSDCFVRTGGQEYRFTQSVDVGLENNIEYNPFLYITKDKGAT